jgi:hypothetical protein
VEVIKSGIGSHWLNQWDRGTLHLVRQYLMALASVGLLGLDRYGYSIGHIKSGPTAVAEFFQ